MIVTAGVAVLVGVLLAVTDLPSQIFGVGLAGTAFCVLVFALNELRRSLARQQNRVSEVEHENRVLRKMVLRLIHDDPKARRDLDRLFSREDGEGEAT